MNPLHAQSEFPSGNQTVDDSFAAGAASGVGVIRLELGCINYAAKNGCNWQPDG